MMTASFSQHFSTVTDPRQQSKISYPLFDVLFLTLCAVIGGAEGWEDIEDFGEVHLDWFQSKGLLKSGVPAHDTIARILSRLDPDEFHQSFSSWMADVTRSLDNALIAIDGKTLRHSYNREDRKSCLHMVSAFATSHGLVLGQVKTEKKSNEIKAIPELLQLLDIKGCLISIDAMGCQKEIATQIVEQGGHYLLSVKGNQEKLHQAVKKQFSNIVTAANTPETLAVEQHRGRLEVREHHVLDAGELAADFPDWSGLKSLGVSIGVRVDKSGKVSMDYRYYISSAELTESRFAEAVRSHWHIENQLHWVLDVTMKEDACPVYRDNGAENLGIFRHAALNMLRNEKTDKRSIRRKQRKAHADTTYLDLILSNELYAVRS